jgi:hypothetical protein
MTFKLTYPAELDLSYFQPHVTYTCMSHVEVLGVRALLRGLCETTRLHSNEL